MKNENTDKLYADFMRGMIDSIGTEDNSKWAQETQDVSTNIRNALVEEINKMDKTKSAVDDRFLDYCNAIRSLLIVYNFGKLGDDINKEKDKEIIKSGIKKILRHVENIGYDITPYFNTERCKEIFGVEKTGNGSESARVTPVTLSATMVFTTLVYFRRAYKRMKLFTREELVYDDVDLMLATVGKVAELMKMFYEFAYYNKFNGWGATLDRERTQVVTLRDTYLVVSALSRFDDAFTKDGEKRDDDFINEVYKYADKELDFKYCNRCLESTYKTAINLYDNTKGIYGKSVFYCESVKEDNKIEYKYTKTTYEQIASSSRSSALFNPLYIALITMYGYNDKEVVIRQFMDNSKLARDYYEKYEIKCPKGEMKLSEYAADTLGYNGNFLADKDLLINEHEVISKRSFSDKLSNEKSDAENGKWRKYYDIARVFQKYLESKHPEELLKIADYREYLNATKDAIDQVQVMYRDFNTDQRLGIVDTDYAMFTPLDVAVDEGSNIISKLNKADISVNNIRPMLLSSKIMIVNALTKYPQADMSEIYNAIKDARYSEISKSRNSAGDKQKWLWNEDEIDMNSTALHCEAIMYDYFDYYETYELGFKSMQAFRKEVDDFVNGSVKPDGSIGTEEEIKAVSDGFGQLKQLVLEVTRQNVELVKDKYQKSLAEKDEAIAEEKKNTEDVRLELAKAKEQATIEAQKQLAAVDVSYKIGETVRGWIRQEIDVYLSKTISMAILNILNGNLSESIFNFKGLYKKGEKVIDADFEIVRKTWQSILEDCNKDPENLDQKISKYNEEFKKVIALNAMFSAASSGLLENDYYTQLSLNGKGQDIEVLNKEVKQKFMEQKMYGKLPNSDKKSEDNKSDDDKDGNSNSENVSGKN